MIRGVNKKVIEIANPNNDYFERVILFVKPNITQNESFLNATSEKYVDKLQVRLAQKQKSRANLKLNVLSLLCLIFAVAFMVALVLLIT